MRAIKLLQPNISSYAQNKNIERYLKHGVLVQHQREIFLCWDSNQYFGANYPHYMLSFVYGKL